MIEARLYHWTDSGQLKTWPLCLEENCQCHYRKKRQYRTNPSGVVFDAINGCWAFVGALPTPATHAAQNGIVMRELTGFEILPNLPFQEWCIRKGVDGRACGRPIVETERLRGGKVATLKLCKEHRAELLRKRANAYYHKNRDKVKAKYRATYIPHPRVKLTPEQVRQRAQESRRRYKEKISQLVKIN